MADFATNGFFLGFIEALQIGGDPLGNRQIRVAIPMRLGDSPNVQLGFLRAPQGAKALRVNRPSFAESPTQPFSMWRNRAPDPSRMYHEWTPWEEAFTDQEAATEWLDNLQAGLDVIGLASMSGTPVGMVVGGVAGALNAALYAGRGNWAGAGLSLLGVIPFVGDAATMGRVAARAADGLASAAREMRAVAGDFARGFSRGMAEFSATRRAGVMGARSVDPLAEGVIAAVEGAQARRMTPGVGTRVFRVWGDEAGAFGRSWTTIDPRTVPNYRNAAGLPDQNSGRFLSEGILVNTENVTTRSALPLHGNTGGLPELFIPDPAKQVRIKSVIGLNPEL